MDARAEILSSLYDYQDRLHRRIQARRFSVISGKVASLAIGEYPGDDELTSLTVEDQVRGKIVNLDKNEPVGTFGNILNEHFMIDVTWGKKFNHPNVYAKETMSTGDSSLMHIYHEQTFNSSDHETIDTLPLRVVEETLEIVEGIVYGQPS